MTGGNVTYMDAVENEVIAGRSLRAQDYKDFANVIILDEDLANSLLVLHRKHSIRLWK